jgi:hypothetical protein
VPEWLNGAVSKTVVRLRRTEGSNPSPSAAADTTKGARRAPFAFSTGVAAGQDAVAAFLAFFLTLPLPLAPTTRKAPRMNGWMRQKYV